MKKFNKIIKEFDVVASNAFGELGSYFNRSSGPVIDVWSTKLRGEVGASFEKLVIKIWPNPDVSGFYKVNFVFDEISDVYIIEINLELNKFLVLNQFPSVDVALKAILADVAPLLSPVEDFDTKTFVDRLGFTV